MDRNNLLIASGLICIVIFLIMGALIIVPGITDTSTGENSTINSSSERYLSFNNSTPEATAISIARLNEGPIGFGTNIIANASLTSDEKYWIVKMNAEGYNDWVVTIDAKILMSKKNGGFEENINTLRSLDELKAKYIAILQTSTDTDSYVGRPYNITLDGKSIWKVPYYEDSKRQKTIGYVYVDVATGKSKNERADYIGKFTSYLNEVTGTGWSTLKEVDEAINKAGEPSAPPFRDALRSLYPD